VVAKSLSPQQRAKVDAEGRGLGGRRARLKPPRHPRQRPRPWGTIGQVIPGIRIQLAAVKTADEAQKEWSRLAKRPLGDALTGLNLTVEGVDLGAKGIFPTHPGRAVRRQGRGGGENATRSRR